MSKKQYAIKKSDRQLILFAETLFKLSFGIHSSENFDLYFPNFSWGKHLALKQELKLSKKQKEIAPLLLRHVAVYILATQLDSILGKTFNNRFQEKRKNIKNASWIIRLIRNAFTHNPFYPKWQFYNECNNHIFEVNKIIQLKTANLHGQVVKREDYGGPLALLRLSSFIRNLPK